MKNVILRRYFLIHLSLIFIPSFLIGQTKRTVRVAMPGCSIFEKHTALYKQFITDLNPKLLTINEGVKLSSNILKLLTQDDIRKIALNKDAVGVFEGLMAVKNAAANKDKSGNPTSDAICAQNALEEMKPDSCKSWKSFFNMIEIVQRETDGKRPSKAPQPKYKK